MSAIKETHREGVGGKKIILIAIRLKQKIWTKPAAAALKNNREYAGDILLEVDAQCGGVVSG